MARIAPLPALAALISADGRLAIRVTPRASADRVSIEEGKVRVHVTAAPDKGRATAAAIAAIAAALDMPRSAITLERGETSREKLLRVAR